MTLTDYESRKEEGGGLDSIEDTVDASIQWPEDYIETHEGRFITAIKNDTDKTMDNRCGDRDEIINHIISECSKLTPKETWIGGQGDPLRDVQEI